MKNDLELESGEKPLCFILHTKDGILGCFESLSESVDYLYRICQLSALLVMQNVNVWVCYKENKKFNLDLIEEGYISWDRKESYTWTMKTREISEELMEKEYNGE